MWTNTRSTERAVGSETYSIVLQKRRWESTEIVQTYALLLHVRQTVEDAIEKAIMLGHSFSDHQPGFQERAGCKTAVIRHKSHAEWLEATAMLDVAYDAGPLDNLYQVSE